MKQEVKESEVRVKHKTGALGEKEDFSSWETFLARRLRETSVQTTRFLVVCAPGHGPSLSSQPFRSSSAIVGYFRIALRANRGATAARYSAQLMRTPVCLLSGEV